MSGVETVGDGHGSTRDDRRRPRREKRPPSPPPSVPSDWTRCHYYDVQKKRFCRQRPPPEKGPSQKSELGTVVPRYCGNHKHLFLSQPDCPIDESGSTTSIDRKTSTISTLDNPNDQKFCRKRRRIPCPLDPSHYIYEDSVKKHSLICPKIKRLQRQQEHPAYCEGINTGGHGSLGVIESLGKTKGDDWAAQLALRVIRVHQKVFAGEMVDSGSWDPRSVTLVDIQNAVMMQDLSAPELQSPGQLSEAVSAYHLKSGGPRHLRQQASLVGHLRRIGALPPMSAETPTDEQSAGTKLGGNDTMVLEVGAGRGILGVLVAGISAAHGLQQPSSTRLIMVERAGSTSKADRILRKAGVPSLTSMTPTGGPKQDDRHTSKYLNICALSGWERVPCDLSHVDMTKLLRMREQGASPASRVQKSSVDRVVVVAKHLCGAGTDLALKSLEPVAPCLSACVMATCCHGLCTWHDYVGRDYLREIMEHKGGKDESGDIGFGLEEFNLLVKWSSGSVLDMVDKDGSHSSPTKQGTDLSGISKIVTSVGLKCGVKGLGRACQRLIDFGRREYLRKILFPQSDSVTEIKYYVPDSTTPQNAALICSRCEIKYYS